MRRNVRNVVFQIKGIIQVRKRVEKRQLLLLNESQKQILFTCRLGLLWVNVSCC